MGISQPLPDDPREHFIYADAELTMAELSELYTCRRGCSKDNLKKRCQKEDWRAERARVKQEIREKTADKVIDLVSGEKAEGIAKVKRLAQSILEIQLVNTLQNQEATMPLLYGRNIKANPLTAIALKKALELIDISEDDKEQVIKFIGFKGVDMDRV